MLGSMTVDTARVGQKRLLNGNVATSTRENGSEPPRSSPSTALTGSKTRQTFSADASIVLIGIRGCGKRSLGFIAAAALRRRFVTEDFYFQQITGVSRQDYLRTHGSEQFHKEDVEISRKMLTENKTGCVIDCGLGSLTSSLQEYLKAYCATNPVIHIVRDIQAVKDLLKLTERAARMLESADPSHRRCSNFEFFNIEDESEPYDVTATNTDRDSPNYAFKLQKAQTDFSNFVRSIATIPTPTSPAPTLSLDGAVEQRWYTHALQIPLSALDTPSFQIKDLEGGGDVVEVLVERWGQNPAALLSRTIAAIRRDLQMPVMVTPAPVSSTLPLNDYFLILRHALRLNVDFVTLDMKLETAWLRDFLSRRKTTRVLGTYAQSPAIETAWQESQMSSVCDKAISLGVDMLRFTAVETSRYYDRTLELVVGSLRAKYASQLSISAFTVGHSGRTTQLFNPILTPVTHELLASVNPMLDVQTTPAITSKRALAGLFASFTLDPLHYYVLGANVANSLSPAMHNAAYKHIGLPHDYAAVNVTQWDDIERLISSTNFGGASIAQPWKVRLTEKIGCLSEHARAIGAINTLIPLRGESEDSEELLKDQDVHRNRSGKVRAWFGANTDWISIHDCLRKNISPRNTIHAKTTALIVGAGGMARSATYALLRLGCQNIFIYNRTVSHAQKMVEHFQSWLSSQSEIEHVHMQVIDSTREEWPADFAQPTIVVSCVTAEIIPGEESVATFKTPTQWLKSESGGTAVEQAYYIDTPFVKHLKEYRITSQAPWNIVDGYEILHTQAVKQFEIMTNRIAPRNKMREALLTARSP